MQSDIKQEPFDPEEEARLIQQNIDSHDTEIIQTAAKELKMSVCPMGAEAKRMLLYKIKEIGEKRKYRIEWQNPGTGETGYGEWTDDKRECIFSAVVWNLQNIQYSEIIRKVIEG